MSTGYNYAKFYVYSNPIVLSMHVGDIEKVDLNGDGQNDISIYFYDKIGSQIYITLTKLKVEKTEKEEEKPKEKPAQPKPQPEKPSAEKVVEKEEKVEGWFVPVVIIILVIIALVVAFAKKKF